MRREKITELIVERANKFGPYNPQQLKQLDFVLSKLDPEEVFYGLYMVFISAPCQAFAPQELAGKLLVSVKPELKLDLAPLIVGVLENWNVSVEELPLYFRDICGIESLSVAIESINSYELNENQKNGLKTMKWWLGLSGNG